MPKTFTYYLEGNKLTVNDIRFEEGKSDLQDLLSLMDDSNPKTESDLKKSLFIKFDGLFSQIYSLEKEIEVVPKIDYTLPFENYPKLEIKNDTIQYLIENIFICFRSSLDLLTQLLSLKVKELPQITSSKFDYLPGYNRSQKNYNTLKLLQMHSKKIYQVFQLHQLMIDEVCDLRDIIIHKQGYLYGLNFWIKHTDTNNHSIWTPPSMPGGTPICIYLKSLKSDIIKFYSVVLLEFESIQSP